MVSKSTTTIILYIYRFIIIYICKFVSLLNSLMLADQAHSWSVERRQDGAGETNPAGK